jgi:hypothetical protein
MGRIGTLLVLGLLAGPGLAWAQVPSPTPVPSPSPSPGPAADTRVTELQTAGYDELVSRAKEKGLAVTGGASDLRQRLAEAEGLTLPPDPAPGSRTLTIDSAQEAGLVTVDSPDGGKLLRLSGGLHVTLVDNDKKVTHIIEASELWYDQANEEMTARGQVVYTMVRDNSQEVFRGESLTFRLSDSQGVFYGGASDRSRTVGTQTLTFRYRGDAIRRSSADLVVLDTGTITSSLGTDPYYQIKAKKIWVLAPGEWGLQDMVLYLGRIPVLYFPFFFQPGDDFFFNPVLSFPDSGDRRGTSLQTTTYLFGKKKKDATPLSFLQLADTTTQDPDRVVKGLFLVRGKPAPVPQEQSSWVLKILADFYSNLGFLTGVDASLPGFGGLKAFNLSGGIGITRTVDPTGVPFSVNPFQAALDPWAQSDWNGSRFGPWKVPFRWGGHFDTSAPWGSLSLEYYSDTLLANDMTGSRSENFNVFSLLGLGPAKKTATAAAKSSLQWTANANLPPATLGASLLWDSKQAAALGPSGDPENNFYYPSQLTLPQASVSWSGTLWPPAAGTSAAPKGSGDLLGPDSPPQPSPAPADPTSPPDAAGDPAPADPASDLTVPAPMGSLAAAPAPARWTSGINWTLSPNVKTDTRFDTASVLNPGDPAWNVLTSRWSGAYDARLNLTTGWSDGAWTASEGLSLHQQAQDTWYLAPSVAAAQRTSYDLQDQRASSGLATQALASTWKPWNSGGPWRESSLQYTLNTILWSQTYLKTQTFDGTKATVTSHQATAQAVYYLWEGIPTVKAQGSWQGTIAPLDPLTTWSASLDLSFPWAKASTRTSALQTKTALTWNPWETTASWNPVTDLSLQEAYSYDLQGSRPQSSVTTLSAWGWSAQYRHQQTTPYRFDQTTKQWVVSGPQAFLPQQLQFGYVLNLPAIQWWRYRNSLSSTVNFSWPITLQQYSNMPLTLTYSVNYKLARFLDFQISEGISNKTAYRYFPALVDSFGPGTLTAVNPLADLWDSISVWDQAALHRTMFKMTNLSVSLVHYLDDWQVSLNYSGSPQLNAAGTQWNWVGTLNLVVQWIPVPELKTQIQVDKDGKMSVLKNAN